MPDTSFAHYRGSALPDLVTTYQAMGIAFKMLGRKLEQLRIFQRFQLMDQADWNVHALPRVQHEFVRSLRRRGLLYPHLKQARAQVKGFRLELVKMQRTTPAALDFQDLAAITIIVRDPYFTAPPFRLEVHRFAYRVHVHTSCYLTVENPAKTGATLALAFPWLCGRSLALLQVCGPQIPCANTDCSLSSMSRSRSFSGPPVPGI